MLFSYKTAKTIRKFDSPNIWGYRFFYYLCTENNTLNIMKDFILYLLFGDTKRSIAFLMAILTDCWILNQLF